MLKLNVHFTFKSLSPIFIYRNLLAVSAECAENCIVVTQRTKPDTLASKLLSNSINNTIDITIGEGGMDCGINFEQLC